MNINHTKAVTKKDNFSTIGIYKISSNEGWFKWLRTLTVLAEKPSLITPHSPYDSRQQSVTSVPGNLMSSSGLCRNKVSTWCTELHVSKTHIHRK